MKFLFALLASMALARAQEGHEQLMQCLAMARDAPNYQTFTVQMSWVEFLMHPETTATSPKYAKLVVQGLFDLSDADLADEGKVWWNAMAWAMHTMKSHEDRHLAFLKLRLFSQALRHIGLPYHAKTIDEYAGHYGSPY